MLKNNIAIHKLRKIWNQVPVDYYDQGIEKNPLQKVWHRYKFEKLINLIPLNSQRILDIGCASGVLTAAIAEGRKGSKVTGVDVYKNAIDFARSKYPNLEFIVADALRLPFKDESFNLVVCAETLEHVTDPRKVLSEIKRILKKDGVVIISMDTGNILFKIIWFLWTKTKGRVWEGSHLHEFNSQLLEDLIRNSGFRIVKRLKANLGMAVIFVAKRQQ